MTNGEKQLFYNVIVTENQKNDIQILWKDCLKLLREKVQEQSYKTWFETLKLLRYQNKELTFEVPNRYFYEFIECKYHKMLQDAINTVFGEGTKYGYCFVIKRWISGKRKIKEVYHDRQLIDGVNITDINSPKKYEVLKDILSAIKIEEGIFSSNKQEVTFTAFYITEFPITIDLWNIIMGDNITSNRVEWKEYLLFIEKLHEQTGRKFSMPTSEQWEYATYKYPKLLIHDSFGCNFVTVGLYDFREHIYWGEKQNLSYELFTAIGNGHEAVLMYLVCEII